MKWLSKDMFNTRACADCVYLQHFTGSAGVCEAKSGCPLSRMKDYSDFCDCESFKKKTAHNSKKNLTHRWLLRKCVYEHSYKNELKRCIRDGSIRHCKETECPHFRPTLLYRIFVGNRNI